MRCAETTTLSVSYQTSFLEKDRQAIKLVSELLRSEPLLPLEPVGSNRPIEHIDNPILWPSWHCPFEGCADCGVIRFQKENRECKKQQNNILPASNHVREAWIHIWGSTIVLGKHRIDLAIVVDHFYPELSSRREARTAKAIDLLEEAIAEKCRATVEKVGMARDRRTLNQMQEVLHPVNCKTLMCFICNSKHMCYRGIDQFCEEYHAGRIDDRNNVKDRVRLRNVFADAHSDSSFYAENLCAKRFRRNYGDAVEIFLLLFKSGSTDWQRNVF